VPFVSILIVPLTLIASLFVFVYPPWANGLFYMANSLLDIFWSYIGLLSDIPHASLKLTSPPNWYWPILFIAILLILGPKRMPAKWLGFVLLLPLFFLTPPRPQQNEFWFSLLDVGQGLAAVVETNHHTLLFDTWAGFSQGFNSGETVIEPFLNHRGICSIDRLIISHNDNDHIGGASHLLTRFSVKSVFGSQTNELTMSELCLAEQSWQWDGVHFNVLSPQ
jgi:competence protein ComEC